MAENQAQAGAPAQAQTTERTLLDDIVDGARVARDPAQKERSKDILKEFFSEVAKGSMLVRRDVESMINARIAQVDEVLSRQLNEIMHHPEFQKL